MRKLILTLLAFGMIVPMIAQIIKEETLSEVTVMAVNYKYLDNVQSESAAVPVKMLEKKVATYDLKGSELYQDDYDLYQVSFYIPEGKIVAAYDKDGKIIRTIEKFENVRLPKTIMMALTERFPNWKVAKDVYRVSYHNKKGTDKKYKIILENGDKRIRVKTDAAGNFL
ncbi:nicotinate-nucleotide adenylyltransferase [Sungkyunkwania multivorans]|uniref:Nicotinate-nucleotide adenylyltransferase n=1 Tax=Sungkyunkwania multivorans TaxID=1173618 RepID=A0ABW3CWR3_9FLAO